MASETAICNLALALVGSESVINLADKNKRARLCRQLFPLLRDEMLRGHPWNFAVTEASLAEVAASPLITEYEKAFALPSDFLRLLELEDHRDAYSLQGGEIYTNIPSVKIRYIQKVPDPERFDSNFTTALGYRLAMDLALPLADDNNLRNLMTASYRSAISMARSMDAQENQIIPIEADEWLDSRW